MLALWTLGIGGLGAGVAPSSATAACLPQEPDTATGPPPRLVCVADKRFRARGWYEPSCLGHPPVPGERYPAANWCRGGGDQIEAIAHTRLVAALGYQLFGIDPKVQWEIQASLGRDRPDVTHDVGGSEVDLYEVKRTNNGSYSTTMLQLARYQQAFNAGGVPTRLGSRLYEDWFVVGRGDTCDAGGGHMVAANRVFISWVIRPGVVSVLELPFKCFDAEQRVTADVPEQIADPEGEQKVVPLSVIGDGVVRPIPGTTLDQVAAPLSPEPAPIGPPLDVPTQGQTGGDPHITSLDGLGFDFRRPVSSSWSKRRA